MVISKINKNISYPEIKTINIEDQDIDANLYQIELFNIPIVIAVGKIKKSFEKDGIYYYPIYLVKPNQDIMQIGIYEIRTKDFLGYLDTDGEPFVEKFDEPVIYHFVKRELIEKIHANPIDILQNPNLNKNEPENILSENINQIDNQINTIIRSC